MAEFLLSEQNKEGFRLEEIMTTIRKEVLHRCEEYSDDRRPEVVHVINNNMKILGLLTEVIELAKESSETLEPQSGG